MKNLYILLLSLFIAGASKAQVTFTFSVDMTDVAVSADGVHIAGNFNDPDYDEVPDNPDYVNWDPAAHMLSDDDMDGVYSIEMMLLEGDYEFKFINGMTWDDSETVPTACRVEVLGNENRITNVTEGNEYLVCWESCAACGMNTIRFRVDMSQEEAVSPNGLHLAGNIQGWDPSSTQMTDQDGDMVYEVIHSFNQMDLGEEDVLFKYINNNSWDIPELIEGVSADCGDGSGNRLYVIGEDEVNTVLDIYCFNSCSSCIQPVQVTFKVNMSNEMVNANGVSVAGGFQGWTPGVDFLTDDDSDGIYETTLGLQPGTYEYKFVNGTTWDDDNESVPSGCNVNGNREIVVGETDMEVEFCYNACGPDCVAIPDPGNITFRVDMSEETVTEEGVWVIGSFSDPQWQAGATQLSDDDSDNVYEATIFVEGFAEFNYKFTNGDPYPGGVSDDSVSETANFDSLGCGVPNGIGGWNRVLVPDGGDQVLDVTCYNKCTTCIVGVEELGSSNLSIYPNPFNDNLVIEVKDARSNYELSLVNAMGQVVFTQSVNPVGYGRIDLDTGELSHGVYTVVVYGTDWRSISKVIKK